MSFYRPGDNGYEAKLSGLKSRPIPKSKNAPLSETGFPYSGDSFKISPNDKMSISEWIRTLPNVPETGIGGAYTFHFSVTGLGILAYITRADGYRFDYSDGKDF